MDSRIMLVGFLGFATIIFSRVSSELAPPHPESKH